MACGRRQPTTAWAKAKTPEATVPSGPGLRDGCFFPSCVPEAKCDGVIAKRMEDLRGGKGSGRCEFPIRAGLQSSGSFISPLLHLHRRVLLLMCKNEEAHPLFQNPQRRKDGETPNKPLRMNHKKSQRLPVSGCSWRRWSLCIAWLILAPFSDESLGIIWGPFFFAPLSSSTLKVPGLDAKEPVAAVPTCGLIQHISAFEMLQP
jgi:hypothetical protein